MASDQLDAETGGGILFGAWCGLMVLLLGILHLKYLFPWLAVRLSAGAIGFVGLASAIPLAKLYRRSGGTWSPQVWLSTFLFMSLILMGLLLADMLIRFPDPWPR